VTGEFHCQQPNDCGELLEDEDAERSGRVMQAMLQMEKIDIAWLVETRNTIEKEGDIEPASKLQLTFCDDWLADETEGIDFPPSYSSKKAAVLFSKLLRPTTKISEESIVFLLF